MLLAITFGDVLTAIGTVIGTIWDSFGNVATVITGNMIIFVPVILAFMLSLVCCALAIMKKLGVRGLNAGGRRRRRR